MKTEDKINTYFNQFDTARRLLSDCSNMSYKKEAPFTPEANMLLSGILDQLDYVFLKLHGEATEWVDEHERAKP